MNTLLEKCGFSKGSPEVDRSLKRKKEVLGITAKREAQLKESYFEELELTAEEYGKKSEFINPDFSVDLLCGVIARGDEVTNWIEQLDSLTKMHLFSPKKYNQIDDVFATPNWGLYPHVVKVADKYYIGPDDGKHRLTMAKCIGDKTLPVFLTEYVKKAVK